ncbi:MAG: ABC transporter ATP-binding protein [Ignavibacteria bacterium RIFOXYB2_FULL_35_12]|nr:MAG: ABC transporter ATP-binding protein [Ignavibacteria bacterium GWA2_36_19]OGU53841.1 MAG: ABC transporter ATP-binding protein [Ignavibacteria bacterium GWC2_35_8]OGU60940.1 MAG: ABC transporter ATP-binding protein [Ignavibacteria bacterium GWF2_35_20]OGU82953.1 MAG: ABC transporter ATP-binding protein [Ignavibacteria bacterium RIFOXYA2_FULL_35_9]OGU91975.1 MAG: ABC transporter ATP-binding protein [Ignavibacteria bacterium RIFOXYA12_FULL_35_25]OGU92517.1 MAG: ABC transporter ATP-binding 
MIEIYNLHKSFGGNKVLDGINLKIHTGETIVIIGRSGSGKSVLIKHIVGLLNPDDGYVKVENQRVDELNEKDLYSLRRKFGFLFQGSALFDSMTVEENVSLPLVEASNGYSKDQIKKIVLEKLELVELPNIQHLKPAELSGGMKKRVGLARALVTNPSYILYDEPTTGLDPIMSDSIDNMIKDLGTKLNVTSVVVTHDMYSVKNVADKVAMIHEGKIYFVGKQQELLTSDDPVIIDFIKRTGV